MRNAPTPGDNIIDSRDVIERLEELRSEHEDAIADGSEADWLEDNEEELSNLAALEEEAENCSDWQHGAQLIADAYFEDYARDLVTDIGDMPRDLPLYLVIDWAATADNIQEDYTSVDFGGETYWIRY